MKSFKKYNWKPKCDRNSWPTVKTTKEERDWLNSDEPKECIILKDWKPNKKYETK